MYTFPHLQGILYTSDYFQTKKTADLRCKACSIDIIFEYHPANAAEGRSKRGQEGHQYSFLSRCIFSLGQTDSMKNLSIAVQEFQFWGLLVADDYLC